MVYKAIIVITGSLCCLSLLVAQNRPASVGSASSTTTVNDEDKGKSIDLTKEGTLLVQLESNASTGYSWAVRGDPSPLKLVRSDYKQQDQSGKAGAPGIQQFKFEAIAPGTSTLMRVYRRPWENDAPPAKTFTLTVKVR